MVAIYTKNAQFVKKNCSKASNRTATQNYSHMTLSTASVSSNSMKANPLLIPLSLLTIISHETMLPNCMKCSCRSASSKCFIPPTKIFFTSNACCGSDSISCIILQKRMISFSQSNLVLIFIKNLKQIYTKVLSNTLLKFKEKTHLKE